MTESPLDTCECGDYRKDHPNNGPCNFNHPGFDVCHANENCMSFRLSQKEKTNE